MPNLLGVPRELLLRALEIVPHRDDIITVMENSLAHDHIERALREWLVGKGCYVDAWKRETKVWEKRVSTSGYTQAINHVLAKHPHYLTALCMAADKIGWDDDRM